jgi:predicted RNase H-like nuclease (RuvC/YqgF family)
MGLFTQKECQECSSYQDKIDILTARNTRLEKALRELKKKYDEMQQQEIEIKDVNEETTLKISSTEIDTLFQKIKNSSYDKDVKRYLRSILMMIKNTYNESLHEFILSKLKTQ